MMRYLRIQDVKNKTKLCKSHIWEQVKKNNFPQPIKLSPRVTVWDEDELDSWMRKQKEISRGKPKNAE